MRLHGYCRSCHRIKLITVSQAAMSRAQLAGNAVFEGECGCREEKR